MVVVWLFLTVTIVGRLALREDNGAWIPSDEQFPSIDEIMQQNLKTLGEDPGEQGSVLSAKDWSLLANDAWLLGGIHAKTEFHFASPLRWENSLLSLKGALLEYPDSEGLKRFYRGIPEAARQYP